MGQSSQRDIGRRARETFRAGQLNRRHSQTFDVARMPNRTHGDAIVNFENLLARAPERDEQNALATTDRSDRASGSELRLDVFAAICDRFDPTIWLFDHATDLWKTSAMLSSGRVLMPSRETVLI